MNKAHQSIWIAFVVFTVMGSAGGYPVLTFQDGNYHQVSQICDGISVFDGPSGQTTTVELASGGGVSDFFAYENSNIIFSGGWAYNFRAYEDSNVIMSGGDVSYFYTYDNNASAISGGRIDYFRPGGTNTVDVTGGSMWNLRARESSVVTVSGGTIDGDLEAQGSSNVTFAGGSIGSYLFATTGSTVSISGGAIGTILYADGDVTMSGGSVGGLLSIRGSLAVEGTNFLVDGNPYPEGGVFDTEGQPLRSGLLTCTLANSDPMTNSFTIYSGGTLTLNVAPEPTTLGLLVVGGLAMLRGHGRRVG